MIKRKSKKQILNEYLNFKRISIKSEGKIKDISNYIKRFMDISKKELYSFTEKDLTDFVNSFKDYSTSTLNGIKSTIKNFVKWFYVDWSSRFRNLDRICRSEKTGETYTSSQMLSKADIEKLVQNEHDLSWKCFWLLFFYGGFRPIEVCNLKWIQIEFTDDGAYIQINSKKNKRNFLKFVPEDVCFYLRQIKNNNSEFVFPSPLSERKGLPIHRKTAYFRLKELSKKVFGKHINPYILRHSVATILYNKEGSNADDVASQMGHTKNMKEKYSHLSAEQLKKKAKRMWIKPELTPEQKDELEKLKKQLQINEYKTGVLFSAFSELIQLNKGIKIDKQKFKKHCEEVNKVFNEDEQRI